MNAQTARAAQQQAAARQAAKDVAIVQLRPRAECAVGRRRTAVGPKLDAARQGFDLGGDTRGGRCRRASQPQQTAYADAEEQQGGEVKMSGSNALLMRSTPGCMRGGVNRFANIIRRRVGVSSWLRR
jgi:hypothetical protein